MPWVFLCFWIFWLCVVLLNAIHAIRSSSPFWAIFFFVVGLLWFLQPFCWWAAFWAELCIRPFKSVNLCEALVVRFRLSRLLFPLLYWEMRGKTSQVFSLIFEMHESLASFPNSLFPNHYFVCKYLCGNESWTMEHGHYVIHNYQEQVPVKWFCCHREKNAGQRGQN